jgi:hypothetical protein
MAHRQFRIRVSVNTGMPDRFWQFDLDQFAALGISGLDLADPPKKKPDVDSLTPAHPGSKGFGLYEITESTWWPSMPK